MQFHQNRMDGIRASRMEKGLSRLFYRICGCGFYWNSFSFERNIFHIWTVIVLQINIFVTQKIESVDALIKNASLH